MGKLIQPTCIQLGAMKSGTTTLSKVISKYGNVRVENIIVKKCANNLCTIDTPYYIKKNFYFRRNLLEKNLFLEPLLKSINSPILILLRNPMERFMSHLQHHIIKMHALNLNERVSKYLVCKNISENKYEYKLNIKDFNSINFSEITPLSKGLYFNTLDPIIRNLDQSRLLFINTAALNKRITYKNISDHLKIFNPGFNLKVEKINLNEKQNTKFSMSANLQRRLFTKKIPEFIINISEENKIYLRKTFEEQHNKMMRYDSYKKMNPGSNDFSDFF